MKGLKGFQSSRGVMNMKTHKLVFAVFILAILLSGYQSAGAVTIGGIEYIPSGSTETVIATFLTSNGGTSVTAYTGFVEIMVLGTGESSSTRLNDAFYVFTDLNHYPVTPVNNALYYQLAVDTSPLIGSPTNPTPPQHNAKHHIVYDIDADVEVSLCARRDIIGLLDRDARPAPLRGQQRHFLGQFRCFYYQSHPADRIPTSFGSS